MAKRIRLLIYEGSDAQIEIQRLNDGIRPGTQRFPWSSAGSAVEPLILTSIELDPARITLLELLRVFAREDVSKTRVIAEDASRTLFARMGVILARRAAVAPLRASDYSAALWEASRG